LIGSPPGTFRAMLWAPTQPKPFTHNTLHININHHPTTLPQNNKPS